MYYPEIDATGEHIANRSGSNYALLLQSLTPGNSLLTVAPPSVPSWWNGSGWAAKPAKPSDEHTWDATTKAWRDGRTLAGLKAAKAEQMRAAYGAAISAKLAVGGYIYDATADSLDAIAQEVQLGALTPTALIHWTLANNTVRAHTHAQLQAVAVAIRNRNTQARARYEARRSSVGSATTAAAVNAIVWV